MIRPQGQKAGIIMAFRFMGVQRLDFLPEGKEEKDRLKGYNLWFTDDSPSDSVIGEIPFKCFIPDSKAPDFIPDKAGMIGLAEYVGYNCQLAFNRRGKLEGMQFN